MSVRRNIIAGWSAHLFTVAIGFFLMPYILGTVGEAQYGAWIFINAVAGYSGLIYSGFGATICRFVADLASRKDWDRLNAVVSSIQTVYFGTALLALAFIGTFAWLAPSLQKWESLPVGEIQTAILIVGLSISLAMIGSVYSGVLVGIQRLDIKRGIEVGVGVVRLILTLACLQQQYGIITLSLIFLTVTVLEDVVTAWFAYRCVPTLSVAPWHTRRDVLAECFGFSLFSGIALVAEFLIHFTDTVIIGLVLGPLAVVPYQIGLRIAQMIRVPIAQIGEVMLPRAGEMRATGAHEELGRLVARGMGLALFLAGGFFIGTGHFGPVLIETWIGKPYPVSAAVLTILVGTQIVALPMVVARKALVGIGQVRVPAFIELGEAFINLCLSLLFIRWWGIVGVAWGTLVPLTLVELSLFLPYAARHLRLTRSMLINDVLAPQVPALLALLLFCQAAVGGITGPGWLPLLGVTLAGGGVLVGVRYLTFLIQQAVSAPSGPHPTAAPGPAETAAGSVP